MSESRCRFPLRCHCVGCPRFEALGRDEAEVAFNRRWDELAAANRASLAFLDPADVDPDGDW
jgi:hypothetical protein